MDATALTHMGIALGAVAAALLGFNSLLGKGPRGMLWILTACAFTWSSMLPLVLRDPDDFSLSPNQLLLVSVLRLCTAVGAAAGVFDLFQKRKSHEPHPLADVILAQPVIWGAIIAINFFALLYQGAFHSALLSRYCASHPIEIIEMTVFFVGVSALVLRFCSIAGQFSSLKNWFLPPIPAEGNTVTDCDTLLKKLDDYPALRNTFILRRLRDALDFVRRTGSADALEPHLRHLEEVESMRSNGAYAMVRIIIWAIPILGLLGTVIGITIAVANLNPETLEESMTKVTHGLGVAFDHTATALSLTMLLMFTKSGVERLEDALLGRVDQRVSHELVGRFQTTGDTSDPNTAAIRRMSDHVVVAIENLASRQAEIWQTTLDGAHRQWADVSQNAARTLKDSFATVVRDGLERHTSAINHGTQQYVDRLISSSADHAAQLDRSTRTTSDRLREGLERMGELLIEALSRHGDVMTASERELAEENRRHLTQVEEALSVAATSSAERQERLITQSEHLLKEIQMALVEAAGATVEQQEQLIRQSEVLLKVVDATGQIRKLEESLNDNLVAVQRTHSFEEMAINLSAAIQLLSARLGHPLNVRPREVTGGNATSQAA